MFVKVSEEKADLKYVCLYCKKYFKADKKGFSNLKKHASKNHPNELVSAKASLTTYKSTPKEELSQSRLKVTAEGFEIIKPVKISKNSVEYKAFRAKVSEGLAGSVLPISAVESTLMRAVVSHFAPTMPLVSRFEITRLNKASAIRYKHVVTEIMSSSSVRSICLSLDGWSIYQQQLVGVLAFVGFKNLDHKKIFLGLRETTDQTAITLQQITNEVAAEYNTPIDKIVAIASDTCSTMRKFGKLICKAPENSEWQTEVDDCDHSISSESDEDNSIDSGNSDNDETPIEIADQKRSDLAQAMVNCSQYLCPLHIIQLIVNDAMKATNVSSVVATLKRLITSSRRPASKGKLPFLPTIGGVRWNSLYMAINEVLKKWEVIQTYCIETDYIENQKLSKFESRIRYLHKFLEPFFTISLCLQREDPVGFLFIPFIGTCYTSFKIIQDSFDSGRYYSYERQFAEGIVKSVEKRCQPGGGLTQYKGYGLYCAQSYLQPTVTVTLTKMCITTAKETLRQWHKAFHPEVEMAMNSAVELISCTSGDDCNEYPSAKRTKLTLDEILLERGSKLSQKRPSICRPHRQLLPWRQISWTTKNLFKMCQ